MQGKFPLMLIVFIVFPGLLLYSSLFSQFQTDINLDNIERNQDFTNDSIEIIHPGQSSPITIVTPENTTYSQPMSGYYLATYGFESDEDGSVPHDWYEVKATPTMINEILPHIDGHRKVLRMYKSFAYEPYITNNNMYQFFTHPQEFGTMEFWVRSDHDNMESCWFFESGSSDLHRLGGFGMVWGSFQVYTSSPDPIPVYSGVKDRWYHVRIQFECGMGNHYELPQFHWRLIIDGFDCGSFNFISNQTTVSVFHVYQDWDSTEYNTYTDALGYSWDPNYNVGDNRNEGLLLSFTNATTLDWIGYSLDGQANVTIQGNHVIPFIPDSVHSIKMFCNDTLGVNYETSEVVFSTYTTAPSLTIKRPLPNSFFSKVAPNYNLNVRGYNISDIWYQVADSSDKISISALKGSINQYQWNRLFQGLLLIRFYVIDSYNRTGHSALPLYKDTTPPSSMIHFEPAAHVRGFDAFTIISLTATDGLSGVSTIEYKIDDDLWIPYAGSFTLSNQDLGTHTIYYRAIDNAGNVENAQEITITLVSSISYWITSFVIACAGALYATILILRTRKRK
jgi:hypothetical protein